MEVPAMLNEPLTADTDGGTAIYCLVPLTCTWTVTST